MANENGAPSAAEKGKGKEDTKDKDGQRKADGAHKDGEGKPLVNGNAKGDENEEGIQYFGKCCNAEAANFLLSRRAE